MESYDRVWERPVAPPKPVVTYGLLGVMVFVFILESYRFDPAIWVINVDFLSRPWTLVTSTFAHASTSHLLFNGMALYFLGPILEFRLKRYQYVGFFLISGAISGVLQVVISHSLGSTDGALGASGAIMAILGAAVMLMPQQKILFFGIIPMKFWVLGVIYVLIDLLGTMNPYSNVGHFAHLSGLALGALVGLRLKKNTIEIRYA